MLTPLRDGCRIYLLRHPELAPAFSGVAVGAGAAELGNRGRSRTVEWMQAFERIAVDAVWSGPQPQCRDAAAVLALAKGLELQEDERLRDQELGRWQGRHWEELAKDEPDRVRDFFQDFGEIPAPEGEALGHAVERFLDWWHDQSRASLNKVLVVVASGSMLTGFAAAMLGMRLSRAVALQLPHGGVGVLDVFANGARIACWNAGALADEDTETERARARDDEESEGGIDEAWYEN